MATEAARELSEDADAGVTSRTQADVKLASLSEAEFRDYNRMAERMELFHNHFRQTWNAIYSACEPKNSSSAPMSASRLIYTCSGFIQHLTGHHGTEEAHIFPVLGQRMDAFKAGALIGPLEQHRQIHAGMDRLEEYLDQCKSGERNLRRQEIKEILDSFGGVLWTHLAEEVEHLGAENMRKYWSREEMFRMPM